MERTARMANEPRSGNRGKNMTVKYSRSQATQRRLGHVFPELARQANDAPKESRQKHECLATGQVIP